jgi:hypothetical protein
MKHNTVSKSALICLIIGLLLTVLTPIIARYVPLPDFAKGFLTGTGLMIEFIALVKIQRSKKEKRCDATLF